MSESESEQEINPDVENDILERLQQFGDSLLDEEDYRKRTKKVRRKKEKLLQKSLTILETKDEDIESESKNSKKKKKLKNGSKKSTSGKRDEKEENLVQGKNKNVQKFKKDLGLLDIKMNNEDTDATETSSNSVQDSKKRKAPEVIVFSDPAKKKKKEYYTKTVSKKENNIEKDTTESQDLFDMKSARFEVQKFGIKGMETTKKEEAQAALAMKLGAKAGKKKYMNYRELMDMKKSEKVVAVERKEIDRQMGYRVSSSGNKKTKKIGRDKNDVGYLDGQVGKYKGGVQMLSKDDFLSAKKDRKFKKSR